MSVPLAKQTRRRLGSGMKRRSLFLGLLFISPWLIGFLLFTLYPLASSLYYSLTRYGLLNPPNFVGLRNYVQIFAEDPHFGTVARYH